MRNYKFDFINFRNNFDITHPEYDQVVENLEIGIKNFGQFSELMVLENQMNTLRPLTYIESVKSFFNLIKEGVEEDKLDLELKDLYYRLEAQNEGKFYNSILTIIVRIVQAQDEVTKMKMILEELSIYNYIPEVRDFVIAKSTSSMQKANLSSLTGKSDKAFTFVHSTSYGEIFWLHNNWFLFDKATKEIKAITLDERNVGGVEGQENGFKYVTDEAQLSAFTDVTKAFEVAEITDDMITFELGTGYKVGVDPNNGDLYLNDKKSSSETTVEIIFTSPNLPFESRDLERVVSAVAQNYKGFAVADNILKLSNLTKNGEMIYIIKFENSYYSYEIDRLGGSKMFKYESATEAVNDVMQKMNFDISFFIGEGALASDLADKQERAIQENLITLKINEAQEALEMINENAKLLGNDNAEVIETKKAIEEDIFKLKEQRELLRK